MNDSSSIKIMKKIYQITNKDDDLLDICRMASKFSEYYKKPIG